MNGFWGGCCRKGILVGFSELDAGILLGDQIILYVFNIFCQMGYSQIDKKIGDKNMNEPQRAQGTQREGYTKEADSPSFVGLNDKAKGLCLAAPE